MENTDNSTDWGLIISIIALAWGLFTFWFYDRKTKRQEEKLNEYQIRKNKQEEEESKKAYVEASLTSKGKGIYTLKIFNKGLSEARNIRIEYSDNEKGNLYDVMDNNIFPHSHLSPSNDHIDLNVVRLSGVKMSFNIFWDDDFESNRVNNKLLTFNR